MALTNKDIERIGEIFGARLSQEIRPIDLLLQKHAQSLYGANGDNGLCGQTKAMKAKLDEIDLVHARQTGIIAAISTAITMLGIGGREMFHAIFGK
jgi:hypothetical protein